MMWSSRSLIPAVLCYSYFFLSTVAFVWNIDEHVLPDEMLTFTERHMFPSGDGPELMEQGAAYIELAANLEYT